MTRLAASLDRFAGVFPAITTPMTPSGEAVALDRLKPLCDFLIDKGAHGLFGLGTTGEGVLLSLDERQRVAESLVQAAQGRVAVVINVGAINTQDACALTRHAAEIGADAAAIVSPFFFQLTDDQQVRHYSAVLKAADDLPVFLYNIPQATGNTISLSILQRLLPSHPNLLGMKDSSGDIAGFQELLFHTPDHFRLFVGSDLVNWAGLALGARGIVSSVSGVFPEPYVALYDAVKSGDAEQAQRAQQTIHELVQALTKGPHVALCKLALQRRGIDVGPTRPPIQVNPEDFRAAIDEAYAIGTRF